MGGAAKNGKGVDWLLSFGIPIEKVRTNIPFSMLFLCFLIVGGAVLAADLITAQKTFHGGCASSRLDNSLFGIVDFVALLILFHDLWVQRIRPGKVESGILCS